MARIRLKSNQPTFTHKTKTWFETKRDFEFDEKHISFNKKRLWLCSTFCMFLLVFWQRLLNSFLCGFSCWLVWINLMMNIYFNGYPVVRLNVIFVEFHILFYSLHIINKPQRIKWFFLEMWKDNLLAFCCIGWLIGLGKCCKDNTFHLYGFELFSFFILLLSVSVCPFVPIKWKLHERIFFFFFIILP